MFPIILTRENRRDLTKTTEPESGAPSCEIVPQTVSHKYHVNEITEE